MKIRPEIAKHTKTAWIPEVKEGDGGPFDSKFSGAPALRPGEMWPPCPNCKKPMQLFLQLNLATLPMKEFGPGLIQLFYCVTSDPLCETECDAFYPFSKSVYARRVDDATIPSKPPKDHYPARRIVGWKPVDDLPHWDEFQGLGVNLTDEEADALSPQSGDKLGGWPHWVQGVEYPECRSCGKRMRLVFQIDSECNVPYMFGDAGCAHLTQCPDHKDELAFAWACC